VIAAMSTATVVIEAAARSGAAGTARAAAALSRAVAAVPGPVTAASSAGCHGLIRDGVATLVRGSADIIELASPLGLGLDADPSAAAGIETAGAGALSERVLACLSRSHGLATAHVAVLAGLDVADVRGILLDLENDGRVECRDGGWAPSPARPPTSRRRP
jgi:DNA processing protein